MLDADRFDEGLWAQMNAAKSQIDPEEEADVVCKDRQSQSHTGMASKL